MQMDGISSLMIGFEWLIGFEKVVEKDYEDEKDYRFYLLSHMIWFFTDCGEWWIRLGRINKWWYSYSPCQGWSYWHIKKGFWWL